MWLGFCSVEVLPSPKVHDQEAGAPVEVSVKLTDSGDTPVVGLAVNAATGAAGGAWLTVMVVLAVVEPPPLVAVSCAA